MTTSLFTNKGSILFLFFFFLFSCSKKDKISPSEPKTEPPVIVVKGTMELSTLNAVGYQVINIKIKDLLLDKAEYEVEVGSKKGKAIRNQDNSLDFMIPGDLTTGKYEVKMAVASNTVEVNLTAPTKVADPDKAFKDFVGDPAVEIAKITTNLGLANPPQYLLDAKQKIDEGMVKFNALSVADKQMAMQILEANSRAMNDVSVLLEQDIDLSANRVLNKGSKSTMSLSPCNLDCYFDHAIKIGLASILITSSSTVVAPTIAAFVAVDFVASLLTGKRAILITKVKAKFAEVLEWSFFPQIKYTMSIISEGFSEGITNMSVKQEKIVKGENFSFKLTPVYRTLLRSDATIPTMQKAASFVDVYDKLRTSYDAHFSSTMGPFPNFVVKEEKINAKLLADWEIKVVSNSNVTVTTPEGLPHNFTVKFDSKAKGDQEFQFAITLKNPIEPVTEKIDAILVDPDPNKIEMLSKNDQNGQSNESLPSLRLLVKDKKGKPMEGVPVHWTVTAGGGTLTAYPLIQNTQSITDENGIANAIWTLGMSGEQTVEATVKKRDGANVSGSPLVFRAILASPDKIVTFDGDNQPGEVGKKLPKMLKVKVSDERGLPLEGVRIKWVALHGGGKMNLNETFTNASGIAEAELTVGPELHQLVQATTVKKDGTVIQANFSVTLFNLIGRWKVESERYRRYTANGTLKDDYTDEEFDYIEFGTNGKVQIVYDRDLILGNYIFDLVNGFITISTSDPDDEERLNSKFKISNPLLTSFIITSDKIPLGATHFPSTYEIAELKLRKQ